MFNIVEYVTNNVTNLNEVGNIAPLVFGVGVVAVIVGYILKSIIK